MDSDSFYLIRCVIWSPFAVLIALVHVVLSIALCVTILGIPLARVHVNLAKFALFPLIDDSATRRDCMMMAV